MNSQVKESKVADYALQKNGQIVQLSILIYSTLIIYRVNIQLDISNYLLMNPGEKVSKSNTYKKMEICQK